MMSEGPADAKAELNIPISVGLVLAAFPRDNATALKYFILLLNRLQRTFEFAFYECTSDDPLVKWLKSARVLDADATRNQLSDFGDRLRQRAEDRIRRYDLSNSYPSQLTVISSGDPLDLPLPHPAQACNVTGTRRVGSEHGTTVGRRVPSNSDPSCGVLCA